MKMEDAKGLDYHSQPTLALWAADCAEHVLPCFEAQHPHDERPRQAIEAARAWARGEIMCGAARASARSTGHAAGTAHVAGHARHAAA